MVKSRLYNWALDTRLSITYINMQCEKKINHLIKCSISAEGGEGGDGAENEEYEESSEEGDGEEEEDEY